MNWCDLLISEISKCREREQTDKQKREEFPLVTEAKPKHSIMVMEELWAPLPHLTHSQVNLLVIKSTQCTFSPRNQDWLWKWTLAVFPSSQSFRCCSCPRSYESTNIQRVLSEGWDFKSETKGAGGFGWRAWGGLPMRRQAASHLNQNHYLEKLQQRGTCSSTPESHDLHVGPVHQTWLSKRNVNRLTKDVSPWIL